MGDGAWGDEVLKAVQKTGAKVLLAVSEPGIRQVALHKKEFAGKINLAPVADVQIFDRARDKASLTEFAVQAGIPTPKSWVFDPSNSKALPISEMRFPVLAKPALATAGQGIQMLDSSQALERFLTAPEIAGRYVIQEYLSGHDLDCSVICQDGEILAHTVQHAALSKTSGFRPCGTLEFKHNRAVLSVIEQTMRALRFNGIAHCDLRSDETDGTVKLIEINARFWGSLMASYVAGINFPELAVRMALGVEIPRLDFHDCLYYSTAAVIKDALKSPRHLIKLPKLLRNSDLWFRLRDPVPELTVVLGRI